MRSLKICRNILRSSIRSDIILFAILTNMTQPLLDSIQRRYLLIRIPFLPRSILIYLLLNSLQLSLSIIERRLALQVSSLAEWRGHLARVAIRIGHLHLLLLRSLRAWCGRGSSSDLLTLASCCCEAEHASCWLLRGLRSEEA